MGPSARLGILALVALLAAGCGRGARRLTVAPDGIDFGRLLQGDVPERTLTLRNGGDTDVTITKTAFNCACFQLHPFGKLLHPGEERRLTLGFDSSAIEAGPMVGKHLEIVTTDARQPRLQVPLEGEVVRALTLQSGTLKLGVLGTPPSLEPRVVEVRPAPGMQVELVRLRATPADQIEVRTKEVDGGFDFSVRWNPPEQGGQGRFLGALEIRTRVSGAGFDPRELEHVVRIHGEWPPPR